MQVQLSALNLSLRIHEIRSRVRKPILIVLYKQIRKRRIRIRDLRRIIRMIRVIGVDVISRFSFQAVIYRLEICLFSFRNSLVTQSPRLLFCQQSDFIIHCPSYGNSRFAYRIGRSRRCIHSSGNLDFPTGVIDQSFVRTAEYGRHQHKQADINSPSFHSFC